MLYKTRGIVFRFTKFGETSIIVTIFTESFGLQSYMVNGVRSKTAKNKIALYQPLTLLNLVVYHRPHANIERIKEISCLYPYQTLTADIKKSTMAMFLHEVINKTVKDESHTQEMFEFLSGSLIAIDELKTDYENAHLLFLIKLSRHLGFGPQFVNEIMGPRVTNAESEMLLKQLLTAEYLTPIAITNLQRRNILDLLLKFYGEHVENFGEIKSVQVLKDVLA
jgi:DNA repair protein RecO (recombination protein O)